MIGQNISHYKIIEKLGAGGMGEVYKAEDTKLNRTVALKFLPSSLSSDPQTKKRFIQEARAASALDHPNICTIHEISETDDGQSFIAMACYDGQSLKDVIGATGSVALDVDQCISIIIQIAKGLARAHEEGIVHRDIKPANIMITSRGEVKILDFGLAKLAGQSRLTQAGSTVGTIAYMSPEQARGDEVDQRTDIWSLSVILYEMLTGNLPFRGDYDQAVIYSILNEDPESIDASPDIPDELYTILNKALAKDVAQRYQSTEELLQDFQPLSAAAVLPLEVSLRQAAVRIWRKNKALTLITAGVVLLLIVFLIFKPVWFADEPTGPREIAVVSFDNLTGGEDTENLAGVIPNLLMTGLNQSEQIRVLSWDYLRDQLKQLGIRDVKSIDRELGYQLCQKLNIIALVTGSFAKMGDFYVTDVKVINPESKEIIVSANARGQDISSISSRQIDELSRAILEGMNAVDSVYFADQKSVRKITTTSLKAYQYYVRAREIWIDDIWESIRFLERAVEIDTTFAMAYHLLAEAYDTQKNREKEQSAAAKAYQYIDRAPPVHHHKIKAVYALVIENDIAKYEQFVDAGLRKNPYDKLLWLYKSFAYQKRNDLQGKINCIEKALKLDPDYKNGLLQACYTYTIIRDKKNALKYVKRYGEVYPGNANTLDTASDVYYSFGMFKEALEQLYELRELYPSWIEIAFFKIVYIHILKQDYNSARQELDNFLAKSPQFWIPAVHMYRALFFYYMGEKSRSSDEINAILTDTSAANWIVRDANILSGYFALDQNDIPTARQAFVNAAHTEKLDDIYDIVRARIYLQQGELDSCRYYIRKAVLTEHNTIKLNCNILQAEILLLADSTDQAIDFYNQINVTNVNTKLLLLNIAYNTPFEKDILPRALIKKGDLQGAINAYEDWVEFHPDQNHRFFINPKYHYRLAKLYEQTGQQHKAIERYHRFLDIWKYADKDLPELVDAKKRLIALQNK